MNNPSLSSPSQTDKTHVNYLHRGLWAALLALTVGIFALVVFMLTLYLRNDIRERIVNRDGEIFTAVAQMLLPDGDPGDGLGFVDVFTTVLQMSRMEGVLAVRVYDSGGEFLDSVPLEVEVAPLPEPVLDAMSGLKPYSSFEAEGDLREIFISFPHSESLARAPLLHVAVPLYQPGNYRLESIAYYTVDGRPIAAEFRALDRNLTVQAGIAFATGSLIFLIASGIAFRRLEQTNQILRRRTRSLLKANQELTLAAKSSAIGAVSAHLVHGLRTPLAGLNSFVRTNTTEQNSIGEEEWQAARETTERMRKLIESVTAILRDERQGAEYEVGLDELMGLVKSRIADVAHTIRIDYEVAEQSPGQIMVSSRDANLITLILVNLLENACKASPENAPVDLSIRLKHDTIDFEVLDLGPGIADPIRKNLFQPGPKGFTEGSGLGLAISHQLAQHLEANLELVETGPQGTLFRLSVPKGSA